MKQQLQILTMAGALSLIFVAPDLGYSQTTVNLAVQNDVPAAGLTSVIIQVKTDVSPNTFGSSTIDVRYDGPTLNFLTNQAGVLDQHNTAFEAVCDAHFAADIVNNCSLSQSTPYSVATPEDLEDGTSAYIRFTATGANVGKYAKGLLVDSLQIDGYEVAATYVNLGTLIFQTAPPAAGTRTFAKTTAQEFAVDLTSLSIGFFNSADNTNETGVILPCPGGCLVDTPLPVELADFSAMVDGGDVLLNWTTASETDNAGFSVEHAVGAEGSFEEVAFVEGAGTSFEARTYTHVVKGLDIGAHRFRLKQLDYDGTFEYSSVVQASIELAGTHRLGAAYPNPFNPSTTFELVVGREQHVKIDIINALGQRVHRLFDGSIEANKPTNFTFEAGTLPTGLYFYRVVGENFAQTRQALLVK